MAADEIITVELVPHVTDDVRQLVEELEGVLSAEYTPEQRHGLPLTAIFQPHIKFFMARLNDNPVGCGGIALFKDFAEVKRIFVREKARGRGVGQAILRRLDQETLAAGLTHLCLETGERQLASLRLYERAGFRRCAAFGDYATMESRAIVTSVFLEKWLVPSPT